MTLDLGKVNQTYEIQKINLPLNVEKRMEALGMTLGSTVDILNNKNKGTLIIKVRGTRFAIGKGISKKICVKEMKE
ncbi:MAG: ferrous iron transport protein A [Velocimicrobium sp.]